MGLPMGEIGACWFVQMHSKRSSLKGGISLQGSLNPRDAHFGIIDKVKRPTRTLNNTIIHVVLTSKSLANC